MRTVHALLTRHSPKIVHTVVAAGPGSPFSVTLLVILATVQSDGIDVPELHCTHARDWWGRDNSMVADFIVTLDMILITGTGDAGNRPRPVL